MSFLDKRIRVFGTPEDPLFLARDVAEWIDYNVSSVNKMLANVDEDEKTTRKIIPNGSNYKTEAWFLTEDGLYEVLMQSRKPKAKEFKKEVKKILKSIRKTGGYIVGQENMIQHRTYERHRSCTFFFYVRPSPGVLPTLQKVSIIQEETQFKKMKKKFESLSAKIYL